MGYADGPPPVDMTSKVGHMKRLHPEIQMNRMQLYDNEHRKTFKGQHQRDARSCITDDCSLILDDKLYKSCVSKCLEL